MTSRNFHVGPVRSGLQGRTSNGQDSAGASDGTSNGVGGVAKWSKATVCKTVIRRFESARRLSSFPAYGKNMDGPVAKVEPVVRKLHKAGKGVIGMKLIGEGAFRNSDEKHDNSIRYVLGLGCVDAMVVGFEKLEETDDFAARVRKVSTALIKKA